MKERGHHRIGTIVRSLVPAMVLWLLPAATPASAQPVIPATWAPQGPAPTQNGQVSGMAAQNNPVTGAVQQVVPHPTNANTLWVGAVNGGVWRTDNATAGAPNWTPLTDQQPSLSISALELDPTDGASQTLVAGFGNRSAFARVGGALVGLLRTTNGGTSWTNLGATDLAGEDVRGVAPRGATIVVGSSPGGVWRSTDGGANFDQLSGDGSSGLPAGQAFHIAGDSGDATRLYAGTSAGVFRSDDTGQTWTNVSGAGAGNPGGIIGAATTNIELAVHNAAGTDAVYAAVVNLNPPGSGNDQLAGLFRSTNQGGAWTAMDVPAIHPGGQGDIHFSITADPTDANDVYVGGDRQAAAPFVASIFRCDASAAAGSQCTSIVLGGTAGNSAPHADSRDMGFDANGDLVDGDDGGAYRHTNPTGTGDWVSVIGNLQIGETHSCEYDGVSAIVMCGTQDAGSTEQTATGSLTWRQLFQADGGLVAVDDSGASSVRFFSTQQLGNLSRRTCDAANSCGGTTALGLTVAGSGGQNLFQYEGCVPAPPAAGCFQNFFTSFYRPVVVNAITGTRMIIATNRVYESFDRGDNITDLTGNTGSLVTRAVAYGGTSGGVANAEVLYYGNAGGLFLRTTAAGAINQLAAYPGGTPIDLVLDPDDWQTAYVVDVDQVFVTTDAGATWTDITGNLATSNAGAFRTVEYVEVGTEDAVVVGTDIGVFATRAGPSLGGWAELDTSLPNAIAFELDYDPADDVLLVGTLGRGAWTLANASAAFVTADLRIDKSDNPDPAVAGEQLTYTLDVTNDGPETAQDVVVTDELPDGVSFVSASPPSCLHDATTNTVTCDLGDLASGATTTVTITVLIDADLVFNAGGPTTITNTASVDSDTTDPDPDDNEVSESTLVVAEADLEIVTFEAVDPPSEILVGEPTEITLRKVITNHGPSAPMDVRLTTTATASAGATVTPTNLVLEEDALGLNELREVEEVFTVECQAASDHTFTFVNEIEPANPEDTDPDLSNNQATVELDILCVVPVTINIKPGSDPNSINLKGNGVISVAVLTTQAGENGLPLAFDATTIDPLSVRFGPADVVFDETGGAFESHGKGHLEDAFELDEVTKDGDTDMVLHFKTKETGIGPTDTEACVKGDWVDEMGVTHKFFGCDAIRIV